MASNTANQVRHPRDDGRLLRFAAIATIISMIFTVAPIVVSFLSFIGIDILTEKPDPVSAVNLLAIAAFLAASFCLLFYLFRGKRSKIVLLLSIGSAFVATLCITAIFIRPEITNPGDANTRTLIGSIEPAPESYQIQRGGVTATVRGVEMQAKTCPMESTSFDITSLEPGDRVTFSLEGFPGDNNPGTYAITIQGAGLSENYRLTPGSLQRIEFNARESGNVEVSISAQHRPDRGSSCDSTNEILAIENTVLN